MPACNTMYQKGRIAACREVLADEDSRLTLDKLMEYRESGSDRHRFIAEDYTETVDPSYFEQKFLTMGSDEVYLDVGVCDGQTIKDFVDRVHNRYKKIYGWEIDPNYIGKAKKVFKDERIEIVPYGAWDKAETMWMNLGGRSAQLDSNGETAIQCARIDDVCQGPVTFIKMDIEGAEQNALDGARETIRKYHPKLAVSVYHRQDDIWQIPLWLHELVPEYKLYLRHHRATPVDTVLYAIPDQG